MVDNIIINDEHYLFIKGNVPSLKNSKIKTSRGIFSSKTVNNYIRSFGIQSYSASRKQVKGYVTKKNEFLTIKPYFEKYVRDYPIKVGFHFVRKSKHKYDFNNANQIIADLLTAHDIIEDDDTTQFLPFPLEIDGRYDSYSKENPGVFIKIL